MNTTSSPKTKDLLSPGRAEVAVGRSSHGEKELKAVEAWPSRVAKRNHPYDGHAKIIVIAWRTMSTKAAL
jgi:hypothetical protein